ncbi:DUF3696 domain-containing protein [Hymenobacter norwichensis]|uniref:DUF3696 domain-containing protein n=1 Tax=Hymenobacter norwichensis TaxID=223903 RepID=UPI0003B63360|nr:DUF3696 domain-containing protein [Hymenobacter norwichensis]
MLKNLRIQNFKSWQDTSNIHFSNLTGFFGTNSSGKSSILQFLLMLKQTVESSDRSQLLNLGDNRSYTDLGTLFDVIYMRKDPSTIHFVIEWRSMIERLFSTKQNRMFKWSDYDSIFSSTIRKRGDNISLQNYSYEVENKSVKLKMTGKEDISNNPVYSFTTQGFIGTEIHDAIKFPQRFTEVNKFYGLPSGFGLPSDQYDEIAKWIFDFELLFTRTYYLGPLREYPNRLYIWGGEQPEGVGNRGEKAVAALLASRNRGATINIEEKNIKRTVEEHVAYWLKELGLIHSFIVQPIAPNRKEYEVRIQRTAESASVFLTDVGFGISQILPVLVLLFYVPEGSTVILEQPEIHLHPAVQAGLADVFIDAIKRRRLQIVLESHSEHLLQRLQRRMAEFGVEDEKGFDSDQAALYFTDIEAGRSKLTPLALDDYGNISNWPVGFFGDPFADAAAMMDAQMRRKISQSS